MQTLREIRQILADADLAPQRRFGQRFLIDQNLMGKLLELSELTGAQTVLEVGPGTGSLTEELLSRAAKVVAVEIDRGMCELLRRRLGGREKLTLIRGDVLSGKHAISREVLGALGPQAHLVANLPYSVATPLVAECLLESWRAHRGQAAGVCRFDRLTFTVQREVAERFSAPARTRAYGPVSVLVGLLGRLRLGAIVPAEAFWPRPKVAGRIVRIDFDDAAADRIVDVDVLLRLLTTSFAQRRKQIGSILHRRIAGCSPEQLARAIEAAGIEKTLRAQDVQGDQFRQAANVLAGGGILH